MIPVLGRFSGLCFWTEHDSHEKTINAELQTFFLTNITINKSMKIVLEDHFEIKRWTKLHDGFLNRRCRFRIVIGSLLLISSIVLT